MWTILLILALSGRNQCKSADTAFVRGYLMESSCAQLQYSGAIIQVRHARVCLKFTYQLNAKFAVLEPEGAHKLWHIDASANGELIHYFSLLGEQSNVGVAVRGSIRKDSANGDTITACAISVGGESGK